VGVNKDSYLILEQLPAEYVEIHVLLCPAPFPPLFPSFMSSLWSCIDVYGADEVGFVFQV